MKKTYEKNIIHKKRHSIGMYITDSEMEIMKIQLKELNRKTKYSRNDILKVVCMKLLSDDDFIEYCEKKGDLS
ncbi:hypothetical protein KKG72_04685 [bacterium]|nr:hypothetical protein [bacterium]